MLRKCSHCNQNGHNSRTCPNRGVKIFGVRFTDGAIRKSASMGNLTDGAIRKSASMGNLTHYAGGASPAEGPDHGCPSAADGYASEDFAQGHSSSSCGERKKGVAWTEDEHRLFLMGLQKLGKGDWRGIARNYVVSRTPTQVASHAQKYFVRQTNASRRKRRTSLFDMVPDEPFDAQMFPISPKKPETQGSNPLPLPAPPDLDEEPEPMDSATNVGGAVPVPETIQYCYPMPVVFPTYVPRFIPFSGPFWSGYGAGAAHEIVKPTATHSTAPVAIDELGGMSRLSLGESRGDTRPSFLSPKLPDGSDRQSAFHANPPTNRSSMNSRSSAIISAV